MNPTPSAVYKQLVQVPKFRQLIDDIILPMGSDKPQSENLRQLIELTAQLAVNMCAPPPPPPQVLAPFPTDKLEFWEACVLAALQQGGGCNAHYADVTATDLLLKRNNLIALLGEKPNEPASN